jgi:transglutaminase-like putative cysteine protease
MRRLSIRHATRYRYATPVTFLPHRLMLRPREGHDVRIVTSRLDIVPAHSVVWHRDAFGNSVAVVEFCEPSDELAVVSELTIEHYEDLPYEYALEPYATHFPFQYDAVERVELAPYQQLLFAKEDDALRAWVGEFWSPGTRVPTLDLLAQLNAAIPGRFGYLRREEPGVRRPSETLASGAGSCRDFATLFMETCRFLGLAARFVSGYLHAPGFAAAEGATHAWTEVYLPGAGWRGYDSTTGRTIGGDHIAVAVSRHPETVPPVAGAFESSIPGAPEMTVEVEVRQQD